MDKQVREIIKAEKERQRDELEMIPSENYASSEVMRAVGSCLMNKYAEGYPNKRYYQGNKNIDDVENLAIKRILKAYNLSEAKWAVNVQPHSGCEANLAVYNALLEPSDKIMSMYLPDGGHLSHGWQMKDKKVTLVSKIFKVEFYKVNKTTKLLDFDQIEKQALKFKPKLIISGGTAYPREINHKRMGQIAKKVGAYYLADVAHEAGLIVGGVMKSPLPWADVMTFTTHKTFRGPRGAVIVCKKDLIDKINFSVMPGFQGGPHMHTIAGIAVAAKEAKTLSFKQYCKQVVANAKTLGQCLSKAGLEIVSGGTDKHLVLVDLRNKDLSGFVIAWALEKAGIVMNRNTVPLETASPYYPSGLRMGTPAVTSRGMKEKEMVKIAKWVIKVIELSKDDKLPDDNAKRREFVKSFRQRIGEDKELKRIKREVKDLCQKFPVPGV
jgi:glycine hydroxymethyltransferase